MSMGKIWRWFGAICWLVLTPAMVAELWDVNLGLTIAAAFAGLHVVVHQIAFAMEE